MTVIGASLLMGLAVWIAMPSATVENGVGDVHRCPVPRKASQSASHLLDELEIRFFSAHEPIT